MTIHDDVREELGFESVVVTMIDVAMKMMDIEDWSNRECYGLKQKVDIEDEDAVPKYCKFHEDSQMMMMNILFQNGEKLVTLDPIQALDSASWAELVSFCICCEQDNKLNEGLSELDKGMTLKAESWSNGKNFKAMMKLRIRNNMIKH
ncbi:unnamed protein product [Vicia faba]|uniref:Uncharacterized protein n=1 Tax=Vicia faba TaxID=3906 RepID=A0AAV1AWS0_VICFA|nr:unnamed protein product [Vicia faba]